MLLAGKKTKADIAFGPPYAVLNLSKLGLRYFRIGLNVSPRSRERLIKTLVDHPNVGWMFSAEGWFSFAVGMWARDNAEINDVSASIRNMLDPGDKIVFQSELTSLYSFGNRAIGKTATAMAIIDPVYEKAELSALEFDYIKLVATDSSMPTSEIAEILNVPEAEVESIDKRMTEAGIIVGHQDRIDYGGLYFKVFIDTSSKKTANAVELLSARLWNDDRCIYFERSNSAYDLEFELILARKSDIHEYVADFSEYQMAILTQNLYTNLYPLSKIANLKQIKDALRAQNGEVIDFGNSKLWYLNREGAENYLSIYEGRAYFEAMEQSELNLFEEIIEFIREQNPDSTFNVIDLGAGDGIKARIFIEKLGEKSVKAYYPVDIQPIELATALKAHAEGTYAKHPILLDFENLAARFPLKITPGEKQVYLFLGATYGNYPSTVINKYIKTVLGPSSMLFVSMPLRSGKSDDELIRPYATLNIESVAFGPLAQIGFNKEDFERNPSAPNLRVHLTLESARLRSMFILKNNVTLAGRHFTKGTVFKMTTSWKPALDEVRAAFESDFVIEKTFLNDDMSISLLRA